MYVVNMERSWFSHKRLFYNQGFSEVNKTWLLIDSYRVEKAELLLENLFIR